VKILKSAIEDLNRSIRDAVGEMTGRWITREQAEQLRSLIIEIRDDLVDELKAQRRGALSTEAPTSIERKKYLSIEEAAAFLGISDKTLRNWRLQGKVTVVKFGRAVRISRAEIERIAEEGTIERRRDF